MQVSQILKTWRVSGTQLFIEFFGTILTDGATMQQYVVLGYGPAIAVDASKGNAFLVTVTDAVNFTISNPTNPPPTGYGETISITISNASGGAFGTGTWGTLYKVTGNVPAIANGYQRTFGFYWNGTHWIETYASAADIPN